MMLRNILKHSKILAVYSDIYNCNQVEKDRIIKEIKKLNIRNSLIIIKMLLSDLNTQYYYQKIYWYKYRNNIKDSKNYYSKLLFSRQGLWFTTKWILAYGQRGIKENISIIDDTLKLLHIQIMIADYLDKSEINPLNYIHKNFYINSERNVFNDIARTAHIYYELAKQKEAYDPKEYIDINEKFNHKYGYTIKEYLSVIFAFYYFNIGKNRYKIMNKNNFFKNVVIKEKVNKIINEISKKYFDYKNWALKTINNSWDYEELIKYPLIQLDLELYVSIDKKFIENEFFEGLYYKIVDVCSEKKDRGKIITFLGRPFEKYISKVTEKTIENNLVGYEFIDEFIYGSNGEKSSDSYIKFNNKLIIIEAKSTRPVRSTFVSEDEESIQKAIEKLYVKTTLQANEAYENILKTEYKNKFSGIQDIYIISVSIENVPYTQEVKQIVDSKLKGKLHNNVKGYCNLNIEEYELLCSMIENNINVIDIIKGYCQEQDLSLFKNYVDDKYLNFKIDFIKRIFESFSREMISIVFNT
ncbi:MAG: hypothetical protein ACLSTJ_16695 [Clostridium neonatale]